MDYEREVQLAKRYANKSRVCKESGLEFKLSFVEFKRIMSAKYCRYTGVTLTYQVGVNQEDTDVTIDRVDNSKGYVMGNVVPCSRGFNTFKANIEHPDTFMTFELLHKAEAVQYKLMST